MQHPFDSLKSEYETLLARMVVAPDRIAEIERSATRILDKGHDDEWEKVCAATGVPEVWGRASFERESSSDYSRNPAQGDRWDRKSVNVPRGMGPYSNWGEACVAAYRVDRLEQVGAGNWTWARACYEGEIFNGMGYRDHGVHSPYLWAGTNIYTGGKYVSDGVWSADAHDGQLGIVPLMWAIIGMRPALALADAIPRFVAAAPQPVRSGSWVPAPSPVPVGHDTAWLQQKLNARGEDPPLVVDGSYGRLTRRAVEAFQAAHGLTPDGLAGPLTVAKLEATS